MQHDLLAGDFLQLRLERRLLRFIQLGCAGDGRLRNAVGLVVAHAEEVGAFAEQPHCAALGQQLQIVEQVGVHAAGKGLVQQRLALFNFNVARVQKRDVLRLLPEAGDEHLELLLHFLRDALLRGELKQRISIFSGKMRHLSSPAFRIKSSTRPAWSAPLISRPTICSAMSTARPEMSLRSSA